MYFDLICNMQSFMIINMILLYKHWLAVLYYINVRNETASIYLGRTSRLT